MTMEAARERQRVEWALCASAWRRHRTSFTEPGREITERMLRLAAPRAGQRVLDLACGVGNPAFDLARLVGPEGRVLGLDLSGPMVAEARTLAAELGAANVEFRTIPGEHELGVPAGGFDVATCRAGLQYMPDRRGAVRAVLAALRPGGRFVAMTLGSAERCMPFQLTNGIVSRHVPLPTGGDDGDGPVALSSPHGPRRPPHRRGLHRRAHRGVRGAHLRGPGSGRRVGTVHRDGRALHPVAVVAAGRDAAGDR